jgi:hypothetical protein
LICKLLNDNTIDYLKNPENVRTLLRICRKLKDYTVAENEIDFDESYLDKSRFNVLYELVYYFEFINNSRLLNQTLKKMRISANGSIPIARTLYNFYLRFNILKVG